MTTTHEFCTNAHLSIPRFELFVLEDGKHIRGRHISDVAVDDKGFPHVAESEQVLGRFLCLGGVMNTVTEDGRPHRLALGEAVTCQMTPVAKGGINVVVTDRRIAGVMQQGDSLWGGLTFERVLLWDLDLRDIDDVMMEVKSGLLGTKEKPLLIVSHLPIAAISLEVIAVPEIGGGGRKEKSCRSLMSAVVSSAASAQMASMPPGSQRYFDLDRLRSGEWEWDPSEREFVAQLSGDDEMYLDVTGGRADRPHWSEAASTSSLGNPGDAGVRPAEEPWWR